MEKDQNEPEGEWGWGFLKRKTKTIYVLTFTEDLYDNVYTFNRQ